MRAQVPKSTSEPKSKGLWIMNEESWSLEKEERLVWFSIDWLCADLAANEGFSLFNFEINGCIDLQLS